MSTGKMAKAVCSVCQRERAVTKSGDLFPHQKHPPERGPRGWPLKCDGVPVGPIVRQLSVDEQILATLTEIRELLRTIHHAVTRQP